MSITNIPESLSLSDMDMLHRTVAHVRDLQAGDSTGHDWTHTLRVWNLAVVIAQEERADLMVTSLAALLHDVGDWKLFDGDEEQGHRVVEDWLVTVGADTALIQRVLAIVSRVSFMGGGSRVEAMSLEGRIVQDADRLDAIGAIGIARCFAFGGAKGRLIHDPDTRPNPDMTRDEYKKNRSSTINHFHEKLLLLKDRMNTPTGKLMAEKRHTVMVNFLDTFESEWQEANSLDLEDQWEG